jgi:elongation factor G
MGELHLDILIDRMKREFNVECSVGQPQVSYKERITGIIETREVYKKQTGGRGKFADIQFELGPIDEGEEGLQFIGEIRGGNIPREFIPSVKKGFQMAMQNGVLAGYPVDSMKVRLFDGSFHPVDSDQLAFEMAAKIGFKNAARKTKSVLLEPIMKLEVVTPDDYLGDVTGDLNKRRAIVENVTAKVGYQVVKAKVPLAEMFGYVTALRTLTSGRATSTLEFSSYEAAPKFVEEEVVNKVKGIVS